MAPDRGGSAGRLVHGRRHAAPRPDVRNVLQARRAAKLLLQQELRKGDLATWCKLTRTQDAQTAEIVRLATKMRFSQQATYAHRAAHTGKRNLPTGKRSEGMTTVTVGLRD